MCDGERTGVQWSGVKWNTGRETRDVGTYSYEGYSKNNSIESGKLLHEGWISQVSQYSNILKERVHMVLKNIH